MRKTVSVRGVEISQAEKETGTIPSHGERREGIPIIRASIQEQSKGRVTVAQNSRRVKFSQSVSHPEIMRK